MADDDVSVDETNTEDDDEAQQLLADAIGDSSEPDTDTESGASDATDYRAEYERLSKEAEKWKSLARRHEGRAKENAQAAAKAKSVEDQLTELRQQMADRDVAYVERNGRLALSQVHAALAEAGIKRDDVAGVLGLIDPVTLLEDGEPCEDSISRLAGSLTKVAGRVSPDHDQGRRSSAAPTDMNDLIRRAAGLSTR